MDKVEHIVDQRQQVLGIGEHTLLKVALLIVDTAGHAGKLYLGITDDRIQRCTQLVRHRRQKFGFELGRFLSTMVCLPERLVGCYQLLVLQSDLFRSMFGLAAHHVQVMIGLRKLFVLGFDVLFAVHHVGHIRRDTDEVSQTTAAVVQRVQVQLVVKQRPIAAIVAQCDDTGHLLAYGIADDLDGRLVSIITLQKATVFVDDIPGIVAGNGLERGVGVDERHIGLLGIGDGHCHRAELDCAIAQQQAQHVITIEFLAAIRAGMPDRCGFVACNRFIDKHKAAGLYCTGGIVVYCISHMILSRVGFVRREHSRSCWQHIPCHMPDQTGFIIGHHEIVDRDNITSIENHQPAISHRATVRRTTVLQQRIAQQRSMQRSMRRLRQDIVIMAGVAQLASRVEGHQPVPHQVEQGDSISGQKSVRRPGRYCIHKVGHIDV